MNKLRELLGRLPQRRRPGDPAARGGGIASGQASEPESAGPQQDPLLPPWQSLIERDADLWAESLERGRTGPRVLIANSIPSFYNSTNLESLVAAALTVRGVEVHVLLCGKALPACMNTKIRKTSSDEIADGTFREKICDLCMQRGSAFTDLQIPVHTYADQVSAADAHRIAELAAEVPIDGIRDFVHEGIPVGGHAYAGCLRFYSRATLDGEHRWREVLRRYFEAALTTSLAVSRLTDKYAFDSACFHHGIYVPQGIVAEVCRSRGVAVTTWNTAYRERCFIFSHGDTYHHTLLDEPTSAWETMSYSDESDRQIREYLESRWLGSQDWIYFHDTPDDSLDALVAETEIDVSRPTIGLLTNVMWDAQLHYRDNAFPSMLDWIRDTIEYFSGHPDLQLLIRVHPAELRGLQPSRQLVVEEIAAAYPQLPPNVFVIPPESNVNTYAAMQRCNAVLIYGTKTGVELTSMGIPVVVAGEAWIRNKGLTTDVTSRSEYRQVLESLPLQESRLSEEHQRRARKYAYHFFMRRMIPVTSILPTPEAKIPFHVEIPSLRSLLPGFDPGLDVICDGILTGTPFVYRSEDLAVRT